MRQSDSRVLILAPFSSSFFLQILSIRQWAIEGLPWWTSGKTLPSNAGGMCLNPGQRARIPHASWAKKINKKQNINKRSSTVTNSIKTLKMIRMQKKVGEYIKAIQWSKDSLFNTWFWNNWTSRYKEMKSRHNLTQFFKMDTEWIWLKLKMQNYKIPRSHLKPLFLSHTPYTKLISKSFWVYL